MGTMSAPVALRDVPMADWMSHLPAALWDIPLCSLAIPGSHNAITYCLDMNDRSPVDLTQPDMLQKLDKYMKPLIRPFVYKWAVTQEHGVLQQLDCGVRYCDLRIAHRPTDTSTDLYFYHGVYTTVTVETVLSEIRAWLDAHPREVVILSFSHFLGLNQELHMLLITAIRAAFATKLCPKTESVTLRNLWALGYQVIVSYEHKLASGQSDLWAHIPYWWANKCKPEALIQEFEHRKQHGRPGSHNAITYCLDMNDRSPVDLTQPDMLQKLDKYMKPLIRPFVYKWAVTQYICFATPTESLKDLVTSTYQRCWPGSGSRPGLQGGLPQHHRRGLRRRESLCAGPSSSSSSMSSSGPRRHQDWMSLLPEELWDTPLSNLAIPGSHDAMSYCLDLSSPVVPSQPRVIRVLDRLCRCLTRPVILRWGTTQHRSIVDQLYTGIRYFDLRIARKPHDSSNYLYYTHVVYTHVTVLAMSDEIHESFILSLKKLFGSKLWSSAVPEVSVVQSLAGTAVLRGPISSQTSRALVAHPLLVGQSDGLFVAGLNLTADNCFMALETNQSLWSLTKLNWDQLRVWLLEQSPGRSPHNLNIIAGDFVGPIPFCPLVIALNKKLLLKTLPLNPTLKSYP
ncbi:hypothetical protein CRUP_015627 [Coryphaenoides rupestris]|nr:hypothetical protein CRUP_015627 [Coryphaenoides rupestris]